MIGRRDAFTKRDISGMVVLICIAVLTFFFSVYGAIHFYKHHIQDNNTPIINNITEIKPSST